MANKKVAPVLGGRKHPRFKLLRRINDLSYALERAMTPSGYSPARADKLQTTLDAAIAEYLVWAPMKNVEHAKKSKADYAAKRRAAVEAERAREKARKEKAREAQKKRNAAARAKAKRAKLRAAKAAKKAAAQAKKDAKKAPKFSLVPNAPVPTPPPFFGSDAVH